MFFNQFDNGYIIEIDYVNGKYLLIFRSEIKVNIIKNKNIIISSTIRTNYDIKQLLIKNNIDIKNVYIDGKKLSYLTELLRYYFYY